MLRQLSACLVLLLGTEAFADAPDLPALFRVSGVAANDGLNLRASASGSAERLGTLPPDAINVEVVELSANQAWGRVNTGEASGWVSMKFLAAQPGPPWYELRIPLTCYGTEPFWHLRIDPAPSTAILQRPEGPRQELWIGLDPACRKPQRHRRDRPVGH